MNNIVQLAVEKPVDIGFCLLVGGIWVVAVVALFIIWDLRKYNRLD